MKNLFFLLAFGLFFGSNRAVMAQFAAPLTLDESIQIALRQHGDIGAAEQGFFSARENITSARSNYFPQIDATLNTNYRNGSTSTTRTIVTPATGTTPGSTTGTTSTVVSSTRTTTTTGVSISQNLFDGGRTRTQVRGAEARALNAIGGVGSARSSLAYEVARNFYEQLRQEKLVAQRQGQVRLAQEQLEQIQAQIEAGVAARVDSQTVVVTLSQAKFDLATAQNAFRIAATNFRNALGLPKGPILTLEESSLSREVAPATPIVPTETLLETPAPKVPDFPMTANIAAPIVPELAGLDEFLAQSRRLRPDLLQQRATIAQSEAALDLTQIERRPQISANAGYNIDPRSTGDRGFTVGLGVSVPIFDAGGRKADVKAAEAALEANQIRLTQLEKDAAAEVETAYIDISGQVERIANAKVLVEAARTNLLTATERYRLGLGIVLDIVNAQNQLFSAQTSATSAVYDYELARANLDRAVGRFAWADPGIAPPLNAPEKVTKVLPIAETGADAAQ